MKDVRRQLTKSNNRKARPPYPLPLRVDIINAQIWQGERLLKLTPKTFAVLHFLLKHAGQLVTKEELLRNVWADTVVTDGALMACIRELRKALGDEIQQPRYIETVHRRGYRWVAADAASVSSSKFQVPSSDTQDSVLVGRDADLAQLYGYWKKALIGERQLVFVTGEPGIGKTTLVEAFLQTLDARRQTFDAPPWIAWGQCIDQYGAGEPYLPVLEALGRLCKRPEGERLLAFLQQHAPTWLVQMPTLLQPADYEALQRKTQGVIRRRILQELVETLEAITAERPLILVLEDLHWSDFSTLDLLSMVARRPEPARLLILGTYRPGEASVREHPLKTIKTELQLHHHCRELTLEPLSEAQVGEYLARQWKELSRDRQRAERQIKIERRQDRPLADARGSDTLRPLVRLLHQRTEGNPLFLVATVEDLITCGTLAQTATGWELQADVRTVERHIPESVRQLVNLQRERLAATERQTLAAASIAGLEFSAAAVAAALTTEIGEIERQCERLVERQYFLRRVGVDEWPDGTLAARYGFLHAVYQQLWHEQVSPTQLQHYHLCIGKRKECGYGERAGDLAVELAVHFEHGRDYRKAIQYLQHGGQNAVRHSAHPEAVSLLTKGLALLETFPDTPERAQQELVLQLALGAPLIATKGYASAEVGHVYARARELCHQIKETTQVFPVLTGLRLFYTVRAEHQTARALGEQMFSLARNVQDPALLLEAHHALGVVLFSLGEMASAREHLGLSIACYDPQRHRALAFRHGADSGVVCRSYEACVLWLLGYPDQAIKRSAEALILAQEQTHPFSFAHALHLAAMLHQFRRETRTTQELAEATIALSTEQGFLIWEAAATVSRGWSLAEQGHGGEGIVKIRQGRAAYQTTGAEYQQTYILMLLAEAYGKKGKTDEGLSTLTEAFSAVESTGERCYEAELYRLKGELTLQSEVTSRKSQAPKSKHLTPIPQAEAGAEGCFLKAIEIARKQHAKSWELRAATSLARLWRQQGKTKQAHNLLSDLYNWFTEGFDTKDLREAKTLVEELS